MRFAVHYREDTPVRAASVGLGLLTGAVGVASFLHGAGEKATGPVTVMAWIVAFIAVVMLFQSVRLLRDSTPAVRLGPDGLRDRRWSKKPINWRNIEEFDPVRRFGQPMVQLRLKNPASDPPTTLLAHLARNFGLVPGNAVLVPVAGLDITAEMLSQRILEIGTAAIEAAEEAEAWAAGSAYAAPPHG